jgi:membrane protease YdiL (CAAX protease family)
VDAPSASQSVGGTVFVLLLACAVLVWLRRNGTLTASSLAHAPQRAALSWPDLFAGLGLAFVGLAAAGLVISQYFPEPGDAAADDPIDPTRMLAAMVLSQAAIVPVVIFTLVRLAQAPADPRRASASRAITLGLQSLIVTLPILAGISMITQMINSLIERPTPEVAHEALQTLIDEPWGPMRWGLILSAAIAAPLMEEVLFRGLIQTSLSQGLLAGRRWTAIIITAIFFGSVHMDVSAPEALPLLTVLGISLGYIYERTGRLWAPIVLHASFNTVQITAGLLLVAQNP